MHIYFDEDAVPEEQTALIMKRAFELALKEENFDPSLDYSISVSFVSMDEIRELNRDYRNVDRSTDVLSFPMYERNEIPDDIEFETELGDVVICREKAMEQSIEFGHSYERELIYLFVHSLFHLLGFDHEDENEKKEMRAKEESVMTALDILR